MGRTAYVLPATGTPERAPSRPPARLRRGVAARFSGWLDAVEAGQPVTGVLHAIPGMGRTTAIHAALEMAGARGFRTILIDGYVPELPGVAWTRLQRSVGLVDDDTAEPSAAALRALRNHLRRLADEEGPLVIAFSEVLAFRRVDLALVEDLVRSAPGRRSLLLIGLDALAEHDPALPDYFVDFLELLPAVDAEFLPLGRLSFEEACEYVFETPETATATARFVHDLLAFTGGVPSHFEHVLADVSRLEQPRRGQLLTGSLVLSGLTLAPELAASVRPRLAGCGEAAGELLEALGAWGLPASIEQLARLTGMPAATVEAGVDELERAGLVRTDVGGPPGAATSILPTRPVEAWALALAAPSLRRLRAHERAADEVVHGEQPGTASDEARLAAAMHILRRRTLAPAEVARVMTAARELIERSRYASARDLLIALFERAKAEQPNVTVPTGALVMLAETASRAGDWADAARMLDSAVRGEGSDTAALVAAGRRSARDLISRGRDDEALRLYARLLKEPLSDARLRAEVEIDAATTHSNSGHAAEALAGFERTAALAEAAAALDLAAEAHVRRGAMLLRGGLPVSALGPLREGHRLARRARDRRALVRTFAGIGAAHAYGRSLPSAERWLKRTMREAQRWGDSPTVSWAAHQLFGVAIELGDWALARTCATLAEGIDSTLHRPRSLLGSRARLALLATLERGADLAHDVSVPPSPGTGGDRFINFALRWERCMAAGDLAGARAATEDTRRELPDARGWMTQIAVSLLPREAALAAALGDRAGLRAVLDEFDAIEPAARAEMPVLAPIGCQLEARMASLDGDWARAAALTERAADGYAALGWQWRRAHALRQAGEARAAAGAEERAIAHLRDAYSLFKAIGATPQVDRARDALRALGHGPPRARRVSSELTPRQLEIAHLAGRSLTDAQIADQLTISVRTVNTHMHQILTRLGLQSRTELRGWLERTSGSQARHVP